MIDVKVEYGATQADRRHDSRATRSPDSRRGLSLGKRSVAFLKYVVEQTLNGSAGQIKERTIGVEVFGRHPSYDTNLDHCSHGSDRLRKRLATYYVDEKHRAELRMSLISRLVHSAVFALPGQSRHTVLEPGTETEGAEVPFETHSARIQFGPLPLSGGKPPIP